jgi:hypothetical protein
LQNLNIAERLPCAVLLAAKVHGFGQEAVKLVVPLNIFFVKPSISKLLLSAEFSIQR